MSNCVISVLLSQQMSAAGKIVRSANAPRTPPSDIELQVGTALLELENSVADLKAELRPLQISSAQEVDVKGGRKAVVMWVEAFPCSPKYALHASKRILTCIVFLQLRPRPPTQGFPQDPGAVRSYDSLYDTSLLNAQTSPSAFSAFTCAMIFGFAIANRLPYYLVQWMLLPPTL